LLLLNIQLEWSLFSCSSERKERQKPNVCENVDTSTQIERNNNINLNIKTINTERKGVELQEAMGRGPNAGGGRGRREFVAPGGARGGRDGSRRGSSRGGGSRGGRGTGGGLGGGGGGGKGGGRGDGGSSRGGFDTGHGGRGVEGGGGGNGSAITKSNVMIGAENQRLMLELLEKLHLTDEDGEDGIGGPELLSLLVKEEKRVFLEENILNAVKKKTVVERQREQQQRASRGRPSKVQVIICAWHHPETTRKRVVLGRVPNLTTLFNAARETLLIKRPKAAFNLETGFYISDTMAVEEGTVICVTTKMPEVSGVPIPGGGGAVVVPLTAAEKLVKKEKAELTKAAMVEAEQRKLEEIKEVYRVRASKRALAGKKRQERSAADIQALSRMLKQRLERVKGTEAYSDMLRTRGSLPIWAKREAIVRLVDENSVVVLSGATGSGKSTQVPQFLLDYYIEGNRGSEVNILVTQPRRISAISLCERVATERCEEVGQTVGYSIRLENRISGATALTFVTTGLLLRRLQEDPELQGVSHVVIDEVHEVGREEGKGGEGWHRREWHGLW